MDKSTKKLMSGSAVYFMGNALTQLISLLLMRFVTGNITPEEYGFFNLVTTISNLVIPFVTLQIADAVFKFVLKAENEEEKKPYFTICYLISFASVGVIIGGTFIISEFIFPIQNTLLVSIYVASYALLGIYYKIVRCLNRNTVFVTGNMIKTVLFLALEILLISTLDMGLEALLLAHIISIIFFLIYAEIKVHALRYFDLSTLKRSVFTTMMRFSLPLMPNAAFWWLTSSVNSVAVSARLGVGVNGIYSVSGKFSSVLAMVTGVLNMAWQDTAIADYGTKEFSTFLTKMFNTFVKLIFSAIAVIIPFIALVIPYIIDPTYYDAIPYAPFLLLAAGISSMSGFSAQIYTGQGKTQRILITSILGMVANILVLILLLDKVGLWAAVFGSLAADTVLFLTRAIGARKEFAKGIEFWKFAVVALMLVVSFVLYFASSPILNLIWFFVSAALAVIFNLQFIKDMFTMIFGTLFKKKKEKERVE